MSETPIAVLFGCDPESGKNTCDPLVGLHSDGSDPITWAHGLKEGVEDDHPGWLWAITGNEAAKQLRRAHLLGLVGIES